MTNSESMLKSLLLFTLLISTESIFAQNETREPVALPRTEVIYLQSANINQRYKLYISLPHGYTETNHKYPVVYLLDADYSFAIVKNASDHLTERNHLDSLIIVGIAYDGPNQYRLNRTRDYTPVYAKDGGYSEEIQKYSGGALNFFEFLVKELFPFINSNFRASKIRCIAGHSYGGLFASWLLFSNPTAFNKYIIISPSLWYADKYILNSEVSFSKNKNELNAVVYMAVGGLENEVMLTDLKVLTKQIDQHAYKDLQIKSEILLNETHNSIYPAAVTNGLRYVFGGN